MSDPADLYERDVYAWTQDQAGTLHTWPERLRSNALDIGHLAEEVEDRGGSRRNAVGRNWLAGNGAGRPGASCPH